jgi:hypothetical protein
MKITFRVETKTVREFTSADDELSHLNIDCQPIGQRLPVTESPYKREGIIRTMLKGDSIGQLTIAGNENNLRFKNDSVDGGHRKRFIRDFVCGKFSVDGNYFSQLDDDVKEEFMNYPLSFCVYGNLPVSKRGEIFRNLNETTDVNHQEMCNSFGDIPLANLIRESVRVVSQINNIPHQLFSLKASTTNKQNFDYLEFDNKRLKTEELIARFVYRFTKDKFLGSSADRDIKSMYENSFDEKQINDLKDELKKHCDFLLQCANHKKTFSGGLTQQDFKMLSFLRFYLLDKYKVFKINDYTEFMKSYRDAFLLLSNNDKKYGKLINDTGIDNRARMISEAFTSYLGAPDNAKKIGQTVGWLLLEFDVREHLCIQDTKRSYTKTERETKLSEQNYKCGIDGGDLSLSDAEAGHVISYHNGGPSTMDNMVMVRREHNRAMGTMNLYDYKNLYEKKSVSA